jgi:hypothetical protein
MNQETSVLVTSLISTLSVIVSFYLGKYTERDKMNKNIKNVKTCKPLKTNKI